MIENENATFLINKHLSLTNNSQAFIDYLKIYPDSIELLIGKDYSTKRGNFSPVNNSF
ncbi:MAG: hypothetical protein ACOCWG_03185 [bacterium]